MQVTKKQVLAAIGACIVAEARERLLDSHDFEPACKAVGVELLSVEADLARAALWAIEPCPNCGAHDTYDWMLAADNLAGGVLPEPFKLVEA